MLGETVGQGGTTQPPQQELWGIINDLQATQRGLMSGDGRCHGYARRIGTAVERLQLFAATTEKQLVTAGGAALGGTGAPPGGTGESRVT